MLKLYGPIFLIVGSNVIYHICTKSTPANLDPLASLLITYTVGSIFSVALYFCTVENANLVREFSNLNWCPFLLGLAIVGLEAGNIYMYKAGWNMNTGFIVQSVMLAAALIVCGYLLYGESITFNKVIGVLICIVGLYFINK